MRFQSEISKYERVPVRFACTKIGDFGRFSGTLVAFWDFWFSGILVACGDSGSFWDFWFSGIFVACGDSGFLRCHWSFS
jgi:hypothetical protein